MKTQSIFLTSAAGKALIAMGIMSHEAILQALKERTVVILAGTTNAYLALEALKYIGEDLSKFDSRGFYRGIVSPPVERSNFIGDVVIEKGEWKRGETIYDAAPRLDRDSILFKGANAVYLPEKEAGVLIGHPEGGNHNAFVIGGDWKTCAFSSSGWCGKKGGKAGNGAGAAV